MVHRDIKPHNLMLSAAGQVRILDFGLAGFVTETALSFPGSAWERTDPRLRLVRSTSDHQLARDPGTPRDDKIDRGSTRQSPEAVGSQAEPGNQIDGRIAAAAVHLTAMGSVMGTPDYIAPEQAADAHAADIRADIYSLGCTLHFLLTGKPPFDADSVLAKLKAHAEHAPSPLTTLRIDVTPELAKIVARMMAKDPAERFQTPAEVAAALAPFAHPAATPPRKRTLRNVLAAAAAILLAGVIYVTTDKGRIEIRTDVDDVDRLYDLAEAGPQRRSYRKRWL
jgi:serine/threonine protein kinase